MLQSSQELEPPVNSARFSWADYALLRPDGPPAAFEGRHNCRTYDTIDQMALIVLGMDNKRLRYRDLIA